MRYFSIKSLLLLLIVITLIPLILFQVFNTYSYYNDQIDTELRYSEQLAEAISHSLLNYIEEIWSKQLNISVYVSHHLDFTHQHLQDVFSDLAANSETVRDYLWLNTDGIVEISSRPGLVGKNLAHLEHIQRMLGGQEKVISDLFVSEEDGSQVVVVGRSIISDGQLLGFVTSTLNIEMLSSRLSFSTIPQDTKFGFVDRNGRIVYANDNNNTSYEQREVSDDVSVFQALTGDIVTTEKEKSSSDDSIQMEVNHPIDSLGWACFITTAYNSIMDKHYKTILRDTVIFLLVSLLSIILAWSIANRITKPINNLKNIANTIMKGDLSARTNLEGYDEIAVTAQAFDQMIENIEQYDKLKTQFFSNLSHELKTPLNVIFGVVQLLTAKHYNNDAPSHNNFSKHLNMIKQNCYRLLRLITNLIDLTRYDSGFLNLRFGNYNIVNITEEITQSVVHFAKMKDITMTFDTDVEEKIIACDLDAIERIMLNLISNAIKFTKPKGRIDVNVYDKQRSVLISVKDDGIGIPDDKLKIIFDRFRQVDASLNRVNEGSGIGLSLVKSLVEALGGTICVNSKLGIGTEFIIELPAKILPNTNNNFETLDKELSEGLVERANIEFSDIYFT